MVMDDSWWLGLIGAAFGIIGVIVWLVNCAIEWFQRRPHG